ncbi:MAG: Dam family site-specific DNA-(adenine-N6)-methyltransferase [Bacteroidales bacterium]|nr:Dam family site-specific DNA-(adenine-N6)-methyltransferase [Bacteroidales bacterium]
MKQTIRLSESQFREIVKETVKTFLKENYVKSPMNYTGGKHKLLPQIVPLFPKNINRFVDLFAGGANVAANVVGNANKVTANDYDPHVIDIYKKMQSMPTESIISYIENRIVQYGLSKTNAEAYNRFRDDYNRNILEGKTNNPLDLFILICYSFNHQIRFNNKGLFNMPFGTNRSSFNDSIKQNVINFRKQIENVEFQSGDYAQFDINQLGKDDFVYCDPPYLITNAAYNEKNGWTENNERQLLSFLDKLNSKGIKFALSNVLQNRGYTNDILSDWSKKYNVHHLNFNYGNSNYHAKDKSTGGTDEVLITNY